MHDHGHHLDFASPEMAAYAELQGEALLGLTERAVAGLVDLSDRLGLAVGRIVDIGSGPGVGSGCLAAAFGSATIVAVDSSPAMLDRAVARAERLGLSDRIEVRRVELPAGLTALGPADIAWASLVVHHVGDEAAALRSIAEVLVPGGVLALVELAGPVRVVPDAVERRRPGVWARLDVAWAAWFDDMRAALPGARPSTGYPDLLAAAGLELLVDEVLTVTVGPPLDAAARRFAAEQIAQTRTQLADLADPADLDALQSIVDDGAPDSEDAVLQASRHLYIARAPEHR